MFVLFVVDGKSSNDTLPLWAAQKGVSDSLKKKPHPWNRLVLEPKIEDVDYNQLPHREEAFPRSENILDWVLFYDICGLRFAKKLQSAVNSQTIIRSS